MDIHKKNLLFVIAAYVSWGILPIFWGLFAGVYGFTLVYQRTLWSFLLLGLLLLIKGELLQTLRNGFRKANLKANVLAAIFLGLNWTLYIYALLQKELIAASMAYYLCPIMSVVSGAVLMKEKLAANQLLALFVLILGAALPGLIAGNVPWLALVIAAAWCAYTVTHKIYRTPAVEGLFIETALLTLALTIALPLSAGAESLGFESKLSLETMLFPITGLITALPILVLVKGMETVPLRLIGILQYTSSTLTVIVSALYFGIYPTQQQYISLALIWLGIAIFFSKEIASKVGRNFGSSRFQVGE